MKSERLPKFRKFPCAFCGKSTNVGIWARRAGCLDMIPCCTGCKDTPLPITIPERVTAAGTYEAYTVSQA